MEPIKLLTIDYTILIAYVAFVIGIGWTLSRYMKTSADFLTSARSIPTWVTGLAFISANLGALELVGMVASGAKCGDLARLTQPQKVTFRLCHDL